jgi:septal ring factor EnvC (AmiA/AmiB activator)
VASLTTYGMRFKARTIREAIRTRIESVRYDEPAPMLLNEMQQQRTQMTKKIDAQAAEIRDLKQQQKQFAVRAEQLDNVQQRMEQMHAALLKLQTKDELVAPR